MTYQKLKLRKPRKSTTIHRRNRSVPQTECIPIVKVNASSYLLKTSQVRCCFVCGFGTINDGTRKLNPYSIVDARHVHGSE